MTWIEYIEEKPTESGYYFVIGKGSRKAVIYFDRNNFDYGGLATNHFNDYTIYWLKE